MVWYLISFEHCIIFHFLNLLQFIYPFTYWRLFQLLSSFGSYEWNCHEYSCEILYEYAFLTPLCKCTSSIVASRGRRVFNFVRNHQIVFQCGFAIFHSHQQWVSSMLALPSSLHSGLRTHNACFTQWPSLSILKRLYVQSWPEQINKYSMEKETQVSNY